MVFRPFHLTFCVTNTCVLFGSWCVNIKPQALLLGERESGCGGDDYQPQCAQVTKPFFAHSGEQFGQCEKCFIKLVV